MKVAKWWCQNLKGWMHLSFNVHSCANIQSAANQCYKGKKTAFNVCPYWELSLNPVGWHQSTAVQYGSPLLLDLATWSASLPYNLVYRPKWKLTPNLTVCFYWKLNLNLVVCGTRCLQYSTLPVDYVTTRSSNHPYTATYHPRIGWGLKALLMYAPTENWTWTKWSLALEVCSLVLYHWTACSIHHQFTLHTCPTMRWYEGWYPFSMFSPTGNWN